MIASSLEARERLLRDFDFSTILDIGSGMGQHSAAFLADGKTVTAVDHQKDNLPNDYFYSHYQMDFMKFLADKIATGERWDAIWMSHVLEHCIDVGQVLDLIYHALPDDGVLAITVPPMKQNIVGGHINLFNEGMLLYRLILAGFDCRDARVGVYGYNISIIVKKRAAKLPNDLTMDHGDIEKLAQFFPVFVKQNFDGRLGNINWG